MFSDFGFQIGYGSVTYHAAEFWGLGRVLGLDGVERSVDGAVKASEVVLEVLVVVESGEAVVDRASGWFLLKPGAVLSSCAAELTHYGIRLTLKVI